MSRRFGAAAIAAGIVATLLLAGCAVGAPGHRAASGPSHPGGAGRAEPVDAPATPPPVDRCAHNTARQLVLVSIASQHAWLCQGIHTAYSTAVTTGMSGQHTRTPTGHYRIQGRNRDTVLTPATGDRYHVKYWIPFDAPAYGFHDSSWQTFPYGSAQYKTDGSHGCVHLPLAAMTFLYHWVRLGAAVDIRA